MAEIASAWVSIVPSAKGFGNKLESDAGGETKSAGKKLGEGFGKVFAVGVAGAAATVVASISSALDQGAILDKLSASLGQTPAESEKFGKIAGDLYTNAFGESFEDAANSVAAVQSSFSNLGGGQLRAVTEDAMNFASIFDTDLPAAVGVAKTVVQNGLAKDATAALDLMTAAAQRTPVALRENVLEAATEYGQFFSQLGFSGEQAFASLTSGSEVTEFSIDKAGDAIKEFTIRSTDMSKTSTDAYKAIGLDAKTMANSILAGGKKGGQATQQIIDGLLAIKNPSEQANTAIALFGTPLEDLGTKNIPAFLKSLGDGGRGLGDFKGAIDRAGATLSDNAASKFEGFKRTIQQTFVDVMGTKVIPAIENFVGGMQDGTGAGGEFADNLARIGAALVTAFNFIKTYAVPLATFAGIIGTVVLGLKLWAVAQAALNIVMALNPIGLVVLAIAALAAGLVLAWQKSETFRTIVLGAWNIIKGATTRVFNAVRTVIRTVFNVLRSIFMNFSGAGLIIKHWDRIKNATSRVWNAIKSLTSSVWNAIKTTVTTVANAVKTAVTTAVNAVKTIVTTVWNAIKTVTTTVWDAIKSATSKAWGAIEDAVSKAIKAAKTVVSAVVSAIGTVVNRGWEGVKTATASIWNGLRGIVSKGINAVMTVVSGIRGKVTGAFSGAAGWLYDSGMNIINGLIRGLNAAKQWVVDKINEISDSIPAWVKKRFNMHSPSRVMADLGKNIPAGLAQGIGQGMTPLEKKLKLMVERIEKLVDVKKLGKRGARVLKDQFEGLEKFRDTLAGKLKDQRSAFADIKKGISEAFAGNLFDAAPTEAVAAQFEDIIDEATGAVVGQRETQAAVAGRSTMDNFVSGLKGKRGELRGLMAAFNTLKGWGIAPEFLTQLFSSGNGGLILELAASGKGSATEAVALFGEVSSLSTELGKAVASNDPISDRIDQTNALLGEVKAAIAELGPQVGAALNRAHADGHKKGKRGKKP